MSSAIAAVVLGVSACACVAQQTIEVQQLFAQLPNQMTGQQASARLKSLALGSEETRRYLALKLPELFADPSQNQFTLEYAFRLAGDLKIVETMPAVLRWFDRSGAFGATTLTQSERLNDDPVAKALVQFGEPAIKPVSRLLENTDSTPYMRRRAASILFNMNLKQADQILASQAQVERDPDLKLYIQSRLDARAKKTTP
jgi:hypothetical protein